MIEYPQYADMMGSTVKTMFGVFFPEKSQKDMFNTMVDTKVALNKGLYESTKGFVESMSKVTTTLAAPKTW